MGTRRLDPRVCADAGMEKREGGEKPAIDVRTRARDRQEGEGRELPPPFPYWPPRRRGLLLIKEAADRGGRTIRQLSFRPAGGSSFRTNNKSLRRCAKSESLDFALFRFRPFAEG